MDKDTRLVGTIWRACTGCNSVCSPGVHALHSRLIVSALTYQLATIACDDARHDRAGTWTHPLPTPPHTHNHHAHHTHTDHIHHTTSSHTKRSSRRDNPSSLPSMTTEWIITAQRSTHWIAEISCYEFGYCSEARLSEHCRSPLRTVDRTACP